MVRVLIVDDVEINRFVLGKIMTDMGHQPILAESAIQALKLMERIKAIMASGCFRDGFSIQIGPGGHPLH